MASESSEASCSRTSPGLPLLNGATVPKRPAPATVIPDTDSDVEIEELPVPPAKVFVVDLTSEAAASGDVVEPIPILVPKHVPPKPPPRLVPARQSGDALLEGKMRALLIIRAELSIAPARHGPVDKLNWVCNRAKVAWRIDFDGSSLDDRREAWIVVDDVIIVRCVHLCDRAQAKLNAVTRAAEVLLRKDLDIRKGTFTRGRYALFTSPDKRYTPFRGPEEFMFAEHESLFRELRVKLRLRTRQEQTELAPTTLDTVCEESNAPFRIDMRHFRGEITRQQFSLMVAGVVVHRRQFEGREVASRTQLAEARRQVCADAVLCLLQDYVAIYDDPNTKHVRIFVSEVPIDEAMLYAAIHLQNEPIDVLEPDDSQPSGLSLPAPKFVLQEEKLAAVREALSKVPDSRSDSDKVAIACARAGVEWNFRYGNLLGILTIFDVEIARITAGPMQAAKEQACIVAVRRLGESLMVAAGDEPEQLILLTQQEVAQQNERAAVAAVETPQSMDNTPFFRQLLDLKLLRLNVGGLSGSAAIVDKLQSACATHGLACDVRAFPLPDADVQLATDGEPPFGCHVSVSQILIGRGTAAIRRKARMSACEDAVTRLLKLNYVVVEGPDGPELVSSDLPLDAAKAKDLLLNTGSNDPC